MNSALTVSILGCGWLGLPLGRHLAQSGYTVKGSTTNEGKLNELKASNIIPFLINCTPDILEANLDEFFQSKVLFLNIPYKRNLEDPRYYGQQIEAVILKCESSPIEFVIFASSSSVYPDTIGQAQEESPFVPDNPRALVLKDIEDTILNNNHFDATVIRFSGLYGGSRQIGRFLSGKKNIENAGSHVNLIHLEDCIEIVSQIIAKDMRNEIFNACSDHHPTRKEMYTKAAGILNLPLPAFSLKEKKKNKIVDNKKIKKALDYQFIHPDPLQLS